jgi:hypothetical protein
MKSAIAFLSMALLTLSAQAYKEGTYNCRSTNGQYESVFKITTLNLNGVALPYLEVSRISHKIADEPNSQETAYYIKGIANHFSDGTGSESLAIAAVTVQLEAGRPACVK